MTPTAQIPYYLQNPDDNAPATMAAQPPTQAPITMSAQPVDPHASLTAPISAPPLQMSAAPDLGAPSSPKVTMAAAKGGDDASKMSSLQKQEQHLDNRLMADYHKDTDPFGSPDNHLGFMGKLLHGLSVAGNVAGDVLIPHTMSRIPGTQLHREAEEQGLEGRLQNIAKDESTENLQGSEAGKDVADTTGQDLANQNEPTAAADTHAKDTATTENLQSETRDRDATAAQGPSLAIAYGHAVQQAIKNGQDPAQDPVVQHLEKAITDIQKQPVAPDSAKPVLINGKPGFAVETPKGWVDAASRQPIGGEVKPIPPPPNYGELMLPTKTATFIDPNTGLPTEQQWDPKTGTYDKPLGLSASNAYGHEAAQAGAVERAGTELIKTLQANRAQLGTLGTWIKIHGLNTPIADPTLAGIQSQLASFAALNPAMHGARGASAMEHFEKLIGGAQQNPDATIAGIQGIMKTAGNINPGVNVGGSTPPPARPANVPEDYTFKDGPKGKGWYKP